MWRALVAGGLVPEGRCGELSGGFRYLWEEFGEVNREEMELLLVLRELGR
jgi:hypothetical protein